MIRTYAKERWLTFDEAGELIDTHLRSIQRRLAAEQTTYCGLIEGTRAEIGSSLLETTDAPISEIANQLGCKNQGNFTRAFYRWAKVSPSQFRKYRSRTN